jgi:hypothetical protein
MANKKDSELTVKGSIVDADLIPLLDSETAFDAEKNKTVLASTLKSYAGGLTEGTWTPILGFGATLTNAIGYFQLNGTMVTLLFSFTVDTTASGSLFTIGGLPYPSSSTGAGKPAAYHGIISKRLGGAMSIDNRCELGPSSSSMGAVSDSAPTGRALSYFSDNDVYGSITYITG